MTVDAIYPSIIILEGDEGARTPRGRVQNRIGLVGSFSRGPVNTGSIISDKQQLRRVFEEDLYPGSIAAQAAMDQGARDFQIVRALSKGRAGRGEIIVEGAATENHIVTILIRDDKGQVAYETTSVSINAGDSPVRIRDKIVNFIALDPGQRILPEVLNNRVFLTAQEFGYQTDDWTIHVVPIKQFGSGVVNIEQLKQVEALVLTNQTSAYAFENGLYYNYDPSSNANEVLPTVVIPNDKVIRLTINNQSAAIPASIDATTDVVTQAGHGLTTGDRIRITFANAPTIATVPILGSTIYYAIVIDANTIEVATTKANALLGTSVDFDAAGTAVNLINVEAAYRLNIEALRALPLTDVIEPYLIQVGDGNGTLNTYKWDVNNLSADTGSDVTLANFVLPDQLTIVNSGRWAKDNNAARGRWIVSVPPSVGTTYAPLRPTRFTGGADGPRLAERFLYANDDTPLLKVTAKSPGVWGNDVTLTVTPALQEFGLIRSVNLRVIDYRRTNPVATTFFEEFLPNINYADFRVNSQGGRTLNVSDRSDLVTVEYIGVTAEDATKAAVRTKAIGTLSFATDTSANGTLSIDIRDNRSGFPIVATAPYSYKQFSSAQSVARAMVRVINESGSQSAATLIIKEANITQGETVTILGIPTAPAPIGGYDEFTLVDAIEAAFVGDTRYETVVLPEGASIRFIRIQPGPDLTALNIVKSDPTDDFIYEVANNFKTLVIKDTLEFASSTITVAVKLTDDTVYSYTTLGLGSIANPEENVEIVTNAILNAFENESDLRLTKLGVNQIKFELLDQSQLDIKEIQVTASGLVRDNNNRLGVTLRNSWPTDYELIVNDPVYIDGSVTPVTVNVAGLPITVNSLITDSIALATAVAGAITSPFTFNGATWTVTRTGSIIRFSYIAGTVNLNNNFSVTIGDASFAFIPAVVSEERVSGGSAQLPVTARLEGLELILEAKNAGNQGNDIEYRARTNNLLSILVLPNSYERLDGGQDLARDAFLRYGTLGPTLNDKDYLDALDVLRDLQANIIGVASTMDENNVYIETKQTIHNALITQAETARAEEGLRFAVLTAPKGLTLNESRAFTRQLGESPRGYAKVIAGWITYTQQPSLPPLSVSPIGVALGHIAVTPPQASTAARSSSPFLRNVGASDVSTGHAARQEYTQNRIDLIFKEEATGGYHFLSGRTISTDPAWYWDTIRRVYNILREELYFGLSWAKSEPITKTLIRQLEDGIGNYFEGKKSTGLILEYDRPSVRAAGNTVGQIVSGNLFVNAYFTPIYPADRITVNIIRQPERVLLALGL